MLLCYTWQFVYECFVHQNARRDYQNEEIAINVMRKLQQCASTFSDDKISGQSASNRVKTNWSSFVYPTETKIFLACSNSPSHKTFEVTKSADLSIFGQNPEIIFMTQFKSNKKYNQSKVVSRITQFDVMYTLRRH